jgi:hypothetical protein
VARGILFAQKRVPSSKTCQVEACIHHLITHALSCETAGDGEGQGQFEARPQTGSAGMMQKQGNWISPGDKFECGSYCAMTERAGGRRDIGLAWMRFGWVAVGAVQLR